MGKSCGKGGIPKGFCGILGWRNSGKWEIPGIFRVVLVGRNGLNHLGMEREENTGRMKKKKRGNSRNFQSCSGWKEWIK